MEKKSFIEVEKDRMEWSQKIFPEATAMSSLVKAEEELAEIRQDLAKGIMRPEEYADVIMCVFDSAERHGITPEEVVDAYAQKVEINKLRRWVKNPDNTYSHVPYHLLPLEEQDALDRLLGRSTSGGGNYKGLTEKIKSEKITPLWEHWVAGDQEFPKHAPVQTAAEVLSGKSDLFSVTVPVDIAIQAMKEYHVQRLGKWETTVNPIETGRYWCQVEQASSQVIEKTQVYNNLTKEWNVCTASRVIGWYPLPEPLAAFPVKEPLNAGEIYGTPFHKTGGGNETGNPSLPPTVKTITQRYAGKKVCCLSGKLEPYDLLPEIEVQEADHSFFTHSTVVPGTWVRLYDKARQEYAEIVPSPTTGTHKTGFTPEDGKWYPLTVKYETYMGQKWREFPEYIQLLDESSCPDELFVVNTSTGNRFSWSHPFRIKKTQS